MRRIIGLVAAVSVLGLGVAQAKLPPPTEEQKAKAAETKAKAAEAAKKAAEALGRAQDAVADRYIKMMKAKGVVVTPVAIAAPPTAAPAPAAPAAQKK